ncbi:MAG: SulP family inorganic anion transporter [Hyphomicrobiaceae bacterium]
MDVAERQETVEGETAPRRGRLIEQAQKCLAGPTAQKYLPILCWLPNYKRDDLPSDLTAGTIVAIMLIPQSMAYALLAGLPPEMGLYSSILPLIVYALFGTSRTLGVGPVAIVSLVVASTLIPMAKPGTPEYIGYAIALAFLSGIFLVALGSIKAGFLTNFMSHPVIAGFTSAAALIIAFSQFKHLLGIELDRSSFIPTMLWQTAQKLDTIHLPTLLIAGLSLALLFGRNWIGQQLRRAGLLDDFWSDILPKAMPLVVVLVTTGLAYSLDLAAAGVKIVGAIPQGLPAVTMPPLDLTTIEKLAVGAMVIAFVGFLESVSIARTLASKRRQKIVPDQELVAMGASNIASAMTGGYPVAGSFSRSSVNFSSGARTQLSAIVSVGFIIVTLLLLTPLLYSLPKAALAAIIVVAVVGLVDFHPVGHMWKYMKLDAVSFLATFAAVLILGVEEGILAGVVLSIAFFLWRTSQPNLVVLGRLGNTEQFRDERTNEVTTYENILLLRVDMSLYFANAAYMEDFVLRYVADHPKIDHFVLVCSSINVMDASALETLESLESRLKAAGVTMHLAAVKSSILKRLKAIDFFKTLEPGRVFISAHHAALELGATPVLVTPPGTSAKAA